METPFDLITADSSIMRVLLATAKTDPQELESLLRKLDDKQALQVTSWAAKKLRGLGVQSELWYGGLAHLLVLTAEEEDRRSLMLTIAKDLGVSKTRLYSSVAIFKHFGRVLLQNTELMQLFPVESLKKLSAKSASPEARQAAIELARRGERVRIKKAKALLAEHSTDGSPPPQAAVLPVAQKKVKQQTNEAKTLLTYEGEVSRITIEVEPGQTDSDPSLVIRDLEAALAKYREDNGQSAENDAA